MQSLGAFSGGVTPDPIPNSEVKPSSADDTPSGESRPAPGPCIQLYNTIEHIQFLASEERCISTPVSVRTTPICDG